MTANEANSEMTADGIGFWTRFFRKLLPADQQALVGTLVMFATIVILGWIGVNEPRRMAQYDAQYTGRSIQRGAALFDSNCKPCHAANGEGTEGVAPALNTPTLFDGTRLEELGYAGSLKSYVELTIAAGRPARSADWPQTMPTWSQEYGGPLRPDQVRDLSAFVLNWGCQYDDKCRPADEAPPVIPTPAPTIAVELVCPGGADAGACTSLADLPTGDATRGEQMFLGTAPGPDGKVLGCNACHSVDGTPGVGPSMQGISGRVPADYDSIEAYVYSSILTPNEMVVEGFAPGVMVPTFGERLDNQSLADLLAFLATQ
jgi:cytochrome c2